MDVKKAVTPHDIAIRDAKIMQRVLAGEDELKDIARSYGITPFRVSQIVGREMGKVAAAAAQEIRAREHTELMLMREHLHEVLNTTHYVTHNGKLTNVVDDTPKVKAVEANIRLSESIRKLHGADMPVRVDHTVSVQFQLNGVPMEALR